jgi:Fe-S-cluster containining protein
MDAERCNFCGDSPPTPEDDPCVLCEHQAIDAGDTDAQSRHDPDECEECLLKCAVSNDCRCGKCCEALIIEASLRDGIREPKIQERASPIYDDMSGTRVQIGWMLNGRDGPCVFLNRETRLCTIHETRPLVCRLYDCRTYEHGDEIAPPLAAEPAAEPPAAGGQLGDGPR